jgi:hypothetical protein
LACCLQGGGVFVNSGTVSIVISQVYSNQAVYVRAHAQEVPSPRWEFLLTCPNLIFQFGSIFGSTRDMYVLVTPANFTSLPWETHVWLVVCRVAVLLSLLAQSQSSTPTCIPIKLPLCVRAHAPNPRRPLVVKRYSCQNLAPKLPLGPRAPCAGAQHLCR